MKKLIGPVLVLALLVMSACPAFAAETMPGQLTITGIVGLVGTPLCEPVVGEPVYANLMGIEPEAAWDSLTYQWFIKDGEAVVGIDGATTGSYTPTENDVGATLFVIVAGSGMYTGELTSDVSEPVKAKSDSGTAIGGAVMLTGTPVVGKPIYAQITAVEPEAAWNSLTYQWFIKDGEAVVGIDGATKESYTPTENDVGATLFVIVSGSGSYTGSLTSNNTEKVEAEGANDISGTVMLPLNGNPVVGEAMYVQITDVQPQDALNSLTYQWFVKNGNAVVQLDGATRESYTPTADDIGSTLFVIVSGSGVYSGDLTSNESNAVVAATTTTTKIPTPKTGVNSIIVWSIIGVVVAAAIVIVCVVVIKKYKKSDTKK